MKTKSKTAFVAAFLIASAAGAMASEGPQTIQEWNYLRNPNAAVPQYSTQTNAPAGVFAGGLIEGRNVGVSQGYTQPYVNQFDRNDAVNNISGHY